MSKIKQKNSKKKSKSSLNRDCAKFWFFLFFSIFALLATLLVTALTITDYNTDGLITTNNSQEFFYNISTSQNTMQWVEGFNITDYINITDDQSYSKNTTGEMSVCEWIRPDTFEFAGIEGTKGYTNFISKTLYSPAHYEWLFRIYNDSGFDGGVSRARRISFYVFNETLGTGIGSYYQNASDVIPGKWIHVCGVVNTTSTKLYVNGYLRDTDPYSATLSPYHTIAPVEIGADTDNGGSNNYFRGAIDEFRIYNYSLNPTEVMAIYNAGREISSTSALSRGNLTLWLPFNESVGNPIDASGQSRTGITNLNTSWMDDGTGAPITQIKWSWDGTNYSLYDKDLVLFYNFDNRSALGENDTVVKDLSLYGNNGTVVGGSNISWTPNGKYGGAFVYTGLTGYINISTNYVRTPESTWSIWIKPTQINTGNYFMGYGTTGITNRFMLRIENADLKLYDDIANEGQSTTTGSSVFSANTWANVIVVFNNNGSKMAYVNGIYKGLDDSGLNLTGINTNAIFTVGSGVDGTAPFNGTIDEVYVYNRTLTSIEIEQIYLTQVTKFNSQNWSFYANQSLNHTLNSSNPIYQNMYYICIRNSTNTEICSSNNYLDEIIPNKIIVSNFTNSKGMINSYFYGVNTHGIWGSNLSYKNTSEGNSSDYEWHRQNILKANIKYIRADTYFDQVAYEDGTFNTTELNSNSGNINTVKNSVKFACENNMKILLIGGNMPTWLANITNMCNGLTGSCTPNNYTRYTKLWTDYINYVSNGGLYLNCIEVDTWNEPEIASLKFLYNVSSNNQTRYDEFNKVYNATYQLKNTYPMISVGAGAVNSNSGVNATNLLANWTKVFPNQIDYISFSRYQYTATNDYDINMASFINNITSICSVNNANCSRIVIVEYNLGAGLLNKVTNSQQYSSIIANGIQSILNNYARNITLINYEWSSTVKNYWYDMVSEAGLDNPTATYYPPYNVTKNFATYCPAGGTVYQMYCPDPLKCVSCKINNRYNLILINTDTSSKNITANIYGTVNYIMDPSNGQLFKTNENTNLGIKDSYDVTYLTTPSFNLTESKFTYEDGHDIIYTNNSMVYFTVNTATSKHIDSILDKPITANVKLNAQNVWGTNCNNVNKIYYTANGSSTLTYDGQSAKDVCRAFIGDGYSLTINPATGSNEITFEVGATELSTSILKLIVGFIALLILMFAVVGILIHVKNNFQEISLASFITYSVTLLIITVMGIMLINYILEVI